MATSTSSKLENLNHLKQQILDMNILLPGYLAVFISQKAIVISGLGIKTETILIDNYANINNILFAWIKDKENSLNTKFIAAQIMADKSIHPIISDFWLKADIVPYFIPVTTQNIPEDMLHDSIRLLRSKFDSQNLVKINTSKTNEVEIAELVTLQDYQNISDPAEWDLLLSLSEKFKGKRMVFINATPQGGGVALMRHALIRLYRLLGVDAKWFILTPLQKAFDITKLKIHNVLQAVSAPDIILTEEDKNNYKEWITQNAELLSASYNNCGVVIIDDPQPAGLIPYIKKINPKAKIIYRSHIQIEASLADTEATPQNITWKFIWDNIKDADLFISHPLRQFIPSSIPIKKTILMPATTDSLDGLNKPLNEDQTEYYLKLFDRILLDNNQTPLDRQRPYLIQIARFDPSKGIPDVIEAFRLLREKLTDRTEVMPQLVICGHGSIDDPDGVPIYNMLMKTLLEDKYKNLANDIKIARLPSSDQLLNSLLRKAKIALQLSHKEGFEVKVTEALMKGIPVVAYNAGGIPLQVIQAVSGFLVPVGNINEVADKLYDLMTDQKLYLKISNGARNNINPQTSTVSNAINWLYLCNKLASATSLEGNGKNVKELLNDA